MTSRLKLAINGASGRMGRQLQSCVRDDDPRFELVYAVVGPSSPVTGHALPGISLRYAHDWCTAPPIDIVVDFSDPTGFARALAWCMDHGVAIVSGTTGIHDGLNESLLAASKRIALLHAANFSLGMVVLTRLLREAAAALCDWDLEIVEIHHDRKQDAPSGTALALGQQAAMARHTTLEQSAVYARQGLSGVRRKGQIGFAVVRGGDSVGEHQAFLMGQGERLELSHRATERAIFARGALEASLWLAGKPPGRYNLEGMLSERGSDAGLSAALLRAQDKHRSPDSG